MTYVDKSTFSHLDGDPQDAPGGGVLAIAQEDEVVGVLIHHGTPFYCFDEQFGGWAGLDDYGLAQYFIEPGFKIVKLGKTTITKSYCEDIKSIRKDPNLPSKSAQYPWEASP